MKSNQQAEMRLDWGPRTLRERTGDADAPRGTAVRFVERRIVKEAFARLPLAHCRRRQRLRWMMIGGAIVRRSLLHLYFLSSSSSFSSLWRVRETLLVFVMTTTMIIKPFTMVRSGSILGVDQNYETLISFSSSSFFPLFF